MMYPSLCPRSPGKGKRFLAIKQDKWCREMMGWNSESGTWTSMSCGQGDVGLTNRQCVMLLTCALLLLHRSLCKQKKWHRLKILLCTHMKCNHKPGKWLCVSDGPVWVALSFEGVQNSCGDPFSALIHTVMPDHRISEKLKCCRRSLQSATL